MPEGFLRWRVPLGFAFAAGYLLLARPSSSMNLLICIAAVAAGCFLRSWAAGYLLKGRRVVVGGPYAYIRNPLYVGSFMIGVGFCAALWTWPPQTASLGLTLAFLFGFGVVYRGKTLAEETELARALGEPYQKYKASVPAFLPFRGRVAGLGQQRFSRELYRRNREYECVIGSAAIILYLYFRLHHVL